MSTRLVTDLYLAATRWRAARTRYYEACAVVCAQRDRGAVATAALELMAEATDERMAAEDALAEATAAAALDDEPGEAGPPAAAAPATS